MTVTSSELVTAMFITENPATGAAENAGVGPAGTLYVNGVASAAVVTVTNMAVGVYRAVVTLPTLAALDFVALRIAATVGGVARESITFQDSTDASLIWAHTPRTLTMTSTAITTPAAGTKLTLWRGDTLDLDVLKLGDMTTADDLWFTVKKRPADADASAEIQISLLAGLQAIAGALATTPANGSLTITSAPNGDITIALAAVEMAKLDVDFVGYYDIQMRAGAVITTLTHGCCAVVGDATRRIL